MRHDSKPIQPCRRIMYEKYGKYTNTPSICVCNNISAKSAGKSSKRRKINCSRFALCIFLIMRHENLVILWRVNWVQITFFSYEKKQIFRGGKTFCKQENCHMFRVLYFKGSFFFRVIILQIDAWVVRQSNFSHVSKYSCQKSQINEGKIRHRVGTWTRIKKKLIRRPILRNRHT